MMFRQTEAPSDGHKMKRRQQISDSQSIRSKQSVNHRINRLQRKNVQGPTSTDMECQVFHFDNESNFSKYNPNQNLRVGGRMQNLKLENIPKNQKIAKTFDPTRNQGGGNKIKNTK